MTTRTQADVTDKASRDEQSESPQEADENRPASRDEQIESPPEADENRPAREDMQCDGIDVASRNEESGFPQRLPARKENRKSEITSVEEERREAFVGKRREGKAPNQLDLDQEDDDDEKAPNQLDLDQEDDDEHESALEAIERNEESRREIMEELEKSQPGTDIEECILDFESQYKERVKLITKDLYGIDCNGGRFIFEEKMPGRMHDDEKWKRTKVRFILDGRSSSFAPKKPETIKHGSHHVENRHQGSIPNPCNRGAQLITRVSKEKYGHLPQFHDELADSASGVFGNIEDVGGLLAGGREKLQQIRAELGSHFRPARSPDETHQKDIEGSVLSPSHTSSLWGVDISEEHSGDSPEDFEEAIGDSQKDFVERIEDSPEDSKSSNPTSGSSDKQGE